MDDTEVLTEAESRRLLLAAVYAAEDGVTAEEVARIADWAEEARIQSAMLDLVLVGEAVVRVKDNEVVFSADPDVTERVKLALADEPALPPR